jgi:hypothetical protein
MKSIFTQKLETPTSVQLQEALGETYAYWQIFAEHTKKLYPEATEEWSFTSEKFGWSFRIKDKKRVIIYLLPRDKFFKVAFVFGQKATDSVLESQVSESIKSELSAAKPYAEGRGIRIDITNATLLNDIKLLINIKLSK